MTEQDNKNTRKHVRKRSATQVTLYGECKRKFYFSYPLKMKPPSGPDAARGERVHRLVELALKGEGYPQPDHLEGRMARALLEMQEPPTAVTRPEFTFDMPTYEGGSPWTGKIDRIDLDVQPIITDFKTTKDFYYAKNGPELLSDPQMVSYGVYGLSQVPTADRVHVRHLYVLSKFKGPIAPTLPVAVTFSVDRLKQEWSNLVLKVRDMDLLDDVRPDPSEIEPNPAVCGKYGGCAFRDKCGFKANSNLGGLLMPSFEELRRNHQNRQEILPPAQPVGFQLPTPALPPGFRLASAEEQARYQMPIMIREADGQVTMTPVYNSPAVAPPPPAAMAPPPPAAMAPPPANFAPVTFEKCACGHVRGAHGPLGCLEISAGGKCSCAEFRFPEIPTPAPIVDDPNSYQSQRASHHGMQPAPGASHFTPPAIYVQAPPGVTLDPGSSALDRAQGETPAATEEKAKRKRRTKEEMLNASAGAAPATSLGVIHVSPGTGPAPLELWVDVLPSKGFPEVSSPVDDWMRPALEIATKLAGADWRSLEYGRGKGYLFAALQQHAAAAGTPTGVVLIRTSMMAWEVVEEFLTPFAARVIRAAGGERR